MQILLLSKAGFLNPGATEIWDLGLDNSSSGGLGEGAVQYIVGYFAAITDFAH